MSRAFFPRAQKGVGPKMKSYLCRYRNADIFLITLSTLWLVQPGKIAPLRAACCLLLLLAACCLPLAACCSLLAASRSRQRLASNLNISFVWGLALGSYLFQNVTQNVTQNGTKVGPNWDQSGTRVGPKCGPKHLSNRFGSQKNLIVCQHPTK